MYRRAMATSYHSMTIMLCLILLFIETHEVTAELTQALCSNYNTGSDFADVTNDYQSNGECLETCKSSYAFAVVQYKRCWCSNYEPADSVDVGSCAQKCPGYGLENCGSLSDGLYGYIALNKKPSGTIGASASSSSILTSTSSDPSPVPTPTTIQPVTSVQPEPSTIVNTPAATTTETAASLPTSTSSITPTSSTLTTPVAPIVPETTSSPSSTSSTSEASVSTPTWSPTPSPSVITVAGAPTTIFVTPTAPPVGTAVAQSKSSNGGFINNKSAVAGVFTTLGLVVIALICLVFWVLHRRRRHANAIAIGSIDGGDTPQRRPSRLSQMALVGGTTRSSMHGIQTTGLGTNSQGDTSADMTPITPRASYPRIVDQRLDPSSLWAPLRTHNGSHASLHSVQDHHDYTRRILSVTNPDS